MPDKRKQKIPPREFILDQAKDRSLGFSLFNSREEVVFGPNDRFVILPGTRGFGWILKVYPGQPEE